MDYINHNNFWHDKDMYDGMSDEDRLKSGCMQGVMLIVMAITALLICALISGCTTTQYVPVIEHHTDTLIQTKVQHDSIYINDSTVITEKGDTVKIEKWHTKYVEKQVHDTLYIAKNDTVPQPYPVIKEVERKRTTMDWVLTIMGMLSILGIIVWVVNKVKRFLPGM